jgi:hypothetical protein
MTGAKDIHPFCLAAGVPSLTYCVDVAIQDDIDTILVEKVLIVEAEALALLVM